MNSSSTRRDEDIIDAILHESELEENLDLRAALLGLRAEATNELPAPSPEILAHFTANVTAISSRPRRKAALITGSVIVIMGLGVGSAAAISPEFRQATTGVVDVIVEKLSGKSAQAPGHNKNNSDKTNNGVGNESTDPGVSNSGKNDPTKNNGDGPSVDPSATPGSTNEPRTPSRPDPARPDSVTPDSTKPDGVKPDPAKPDPVKPDKPTKTDKPTSTPANGSTGSGSTDGGLSTEKDAGKPDKPSQ